MAQLPAKNATAPENIDTKKVDTSIAGLQKSNLYLHLDCTYCTGNQ